METDGTRRRRNPLERMFVFLPGSGRLLQIIWPFLVIVLLLLLLANESMHILSAARAYSEGESLCPKGKSARCSTSCVTRKRTPKMITGNIWRPFRCRWVTKRRGGRWRSRIRTTLQCGRGLSKGEIILTTFPV